MTNTTSRTDGHSDVPVWLVLYPAADYSPVVRSVLALNDGDAALVAALPASADRDPSGPVPFAEVYCADSGSSFDVFPGARGLMAFSMDAPDPEDEEGELLGHVGVDSGVVMVGDPCYGADEDTDALMAAITADRGETSTPRGELGGIAVPTPCGDGIFPVYAERDDNGRVVRLTVELD